MKAFAVIAQNADGTPAAAAPVNWVHLGGQSLSGTHKAYKVAAMPATIDDLEADPATLLVLRITNGELDEEWPQGLALLNGLMAQVGLPLFPDGITAREILAALQINPDGYDVSDPEAEGGE